VIVNVVVTLTLPWDAVRVTGLDVVTALWVTLNVAPVLPAGMVMLDGVAAIALLELASATTEPPAGAGPLRVTVPITIVWELPLTVPGLTEMERSTGAVIVRFADADEDR
jgi:hypothetical protein